jgi:hypothetical protein
MYRLLRDVIVAWANQRVAPYGLERYTITVATSIQVAVVFVGHVGRHEHLDVLPDRLLLAVPERLRRRLVVLLDDAFRVDLSKCGRISARG